MCNSNKMFDEFWLIGQVWSSVKWCMSLVDFENLEKMKDSFHSFHKNRLRYSREWALQSFPESARTRRIPTKFVEAEVHPAPHGQLAAMSTAFKMALGVPGAAPPPQAGVMKVIVPPDAAPGGQILVLSKDTNEY